MYAQEHEALLRRIVQVLEAEPRVQAAWLLGSFGRGAADEWSDLDLHLAIDDADFERFLEERESLYRRVGHPILIQHDMVQDSRAGARFQLQYLF
jgi:predicted nucleotidyltransferase